MKNVRLGIAGLGTVAQGVLQIIADNGESIASRSGVNLSVSAVASRTPRPEVNLLGARFSTSVADLVNAPDVDMVLELIGGEGVAADLMADALAAGKPVVTANKAVIASKGNELLGGAAAPLRFEAAVAGAIPIIQSIRQGLVANRFEHVAGIINGTCNYILTAMAEDGAAFDDALSTAQRLGYAEADPTFDVEGIDAAHKLAILLGLAFDTPFDFDALYIEGITRVTAEDIRYARELGYSIKHLGIARHSDEGIEARVHPTLVPQEQLLASVSGVLNAVLVKSDAAGNTMFSGPGAGGAATASAVLADVVDIARCGLENHAVADRNVVEPKAILPITQVRCAHYLRIPAADEAGVFAKIANALSSHGISIEAAIQKEPPSGVQQASVVILTNVAVEADVAAAQAELAELPQITGPIVRIRVEALD